MLKLPESITTCLFDLDGVLTQTAAPHEVSLASPVGTALVGTRSGDVVQVDLPSGDRRTLRVLEVDVSRRNDR